MADSITDLEYTSLKGQYGPGLSLQDMRLLDMKVKLTGEDPKASVSDLEAQYLDQQVPGTGMSRSDNENIFYAGGGSISDDKYTSLGVVTNLVTDPGPYSWWAGSAWGSNDPAKWATTYVAGEVHVNRTVTADALVTASMYSLGLSPPNPVLPAGQYQVSVEVFSTVPVTCQSNGQSIPAGVWTKVKNNITIGAADYYTYLHLTAASNPGTGVLTKLRKSMLIKAPWVPELAYADGNSPGWKWDGTPEASTSSGPPRFPVVGPLVTIDQWMSTTPFFAGHRGEWVGYPEHSAESYGGAFADGALALEWSIQPNSQGVFYHMHDIGGATGLNRTTNGTGDVSSKTTAEMDALIIDIADAGPYWPTATIRVPKFLSMMALYFNKVVILLESKDYTNPAIDALFAILDAQFPGYQQSIIWKQHVGGGSVPYGMQQAAARGMKIWAYIDAPLDGVELTNAVARGDFIGVPRNDITGGGFSDADIDTAVAAAGSKKVIAWSPTRRSTMSNLSARGVDGFVTPNIRYSKNPFTQGQAASSFATGKWSVGDHNADSSRALTLTSGQDYARFANTLSGQSCCLGSLCPTPASGYAIVYEVSYEVLPTAANFCGLAFGKASDAFYQIGQTTNPDGGYVLQSKGDGSIQLTRHLPLSGTNTNIGSALTGSWPAGSYMKVKVVVNAGDIKFQRQDGTPSAVITVTDTTYRGNYLYLVRNHGAGTGEICRFKNIQYTTDLNFL